MSEKTTQFPTIKDIPTSAWKKLSGKKIFFGHQSVGSNIIDGIKDLMKENSQIRINIVETKNPSDLNVPMFAHSRVGKNTDPRSKIEAFASFMEQGIGGKADNALFKFCFVDIDVRTDLEKIFADYKRKMSKLKNQYSETTFVHVTVPLTLSKTTFKTWIKKFLRI